MSAIDKSGCEGHGVVERSQVDSQVMPPDDIRMCIAELRSALNGIISHPSIPITVSMAAELMNSSGKIAQKYACYRDCI
jgi:hypothetical protein